MPAPHLGVINYGIGNIGSVRAALLQLSIDSFVIETVKDFERASHVILPGVGAFGLGMQNLKARGFDEALKTKVVDQQKPLLGICLGMQLLASDGTEFGNTPGLGLIPGRVVKLESGSLRLPHIGWNDIELTRTDDVFTSQLNHQDFYFVHSYAIVPDDPRDVAAVTTYGQKFVACVGRGRIFGAQFHPEKSQKFGLKLLKNFSEIAPC